VVLGILLLTSYRFRTKRQLWGAILREARTIPPDVEAFLHEFYDQSSKGFTSERDVRH